MSTQKKQSGTNIVLQGRIVWGGVKKSIKKVYGTQLNAIDPKTGKEIEEWGFGLAIPKITANSDAYVQQNFKTYWDAICLEGSKAGQTQPVPTAVTKVRGGFHRKFEDGDGTKADGTPFPEHYKGHYVIACKTRFPLKLMAWENGQCVQVSEDAIKCGDYVQVAINVDNHTGTNAGLYLNPSFVARTSYGEAIVNAPSGEQIFGATPPPLMGGSVMPMGGALPGMPQQPSAPMGNMMPPQPVTPNYGVLPQAMQPQQPVAPNYGVLPQAVQPPQPATTPGFAMPPQFGGNGQR